MFLFLSHRTNHNIYPYAEMLMISLVLLTWSGFPNEIFQGVVFIRVSRNIRERRYKLKLLRIFHIRVNLAG